MPQDIKITLTDEEGSRFNQQLQQSLAAQTSTGYQPVTFTSPPVTLINPQDAPAVTVYATPPFSGYTVLNELDTMGDVYVMCRTSKGDNVYVALQAIFSLFKKETMKEWSTKGMVYDL